MNEHRPPRFQPRRLVRRLARADFRRRLLPGHADRRGRPGGAAGLDPRRRPVRRSRTIPGMRSGRTCASWRADRTIGSSRAIQRPGSAGYGRDRGQLWLLGLVALIGIPVGIGRGCLPRGILAARDGCGGSIQTNIANLAGVPSIVYGILGLALFVRAFGIKSLALGHVCLREC